MNEKCRVMQLNLKFGMTVKRDCQAWESMQSNNFEILKCAFLMLSGGETVAKESRKRSRHVEARKRNIKRMDAYMYCILSWRTTHTLVYVLFLMRATSVNVF